MIPKGLTPRIAELGKIKIGGKSEQVRKTGGGREWRAPEKYDHFVITTLERNKSDQLVPDERLMDSLIQENGDRDGKLRQIPIYLLSDNIDEVLLSRYVLYKGRKRVAYCDGDTATWFYGKNEQALSPPRSIPCDGEHEKNGWKIHTALNCVIASGSARFGGVYKFRTTSVISTEQLYGGLLHIQSLTGGVLTGIPMHLIVRPMQVTPGGKETTVYVCHLELHGSDLGEIQQKALAAAEYKAKHQRQVREAQRQYAALLAAPGDYESDIEQADIQEEYHPDVPELPAADPWAQATTVPEVEDLEGSNL